MIDPRQTCKAIPEIIEAFNEFFRDCLLPNQLKNGTRLIGQRVNAARDEIAAVREYASMEEYQAGTAMNYGAFRVRPYELILRICGE